jgi:hypothetical protein
LIAAFVGVTIVILAAHDIPLARYLRTVETERLVASIQRDAFILAGTSEDALSGEPTADPSRAPGSDALQTTVDLYQARTGGSVVITDEAGIAVAVSGDESRRGDDYSTRPRSPPRSRAIPLRAPHVETLGVDIVYVAVPCCRAPCRSVSSASPIRRRPSMIGSRARCADRDRRRDLAVCRGAGAVLMAATIVRPIRRCKSDRARRGRRLRQPCGDRRGCPGDRGLATSFNSMTRRSPRWSNANERSPVMHRTSSAHR